MHTLIFDIGKTHKKCLVFGPDGSVLAEEETRLPETTDDEGHPAEDIHLLTAWVEEGYRRWTTDRRFQIGAVNAAAYGASFVHLDAQGQPVFPLYDYLKPFPVTLRDRFLAHYGPEAALTVATASPWLGMLNSGLQLYWLRHRDPEAWARVQWSLHLPQYVAGLLSGRWQNEYTSLGCHTLLWDFSRQALHHWVIREGVDRVLPPPVAAAAVTLGPDGRRFGPGIHDSSAALVPFFGLARAPFLLISTGTWCITLNPFATDPLREDELRRDCLYYLGYHGQPVKASRLFLGREHEVQVARLARHFGQAEDHYRHLRPDPGLFAGLAAGRLGQAPFFPEVLPRQDAAFSGTSWEVSGYPHYAAAYHDLMRALTARVAESVAWVSGTAHPDKIFVDGGFARNPVFLAALQQQLPQAILQTAHIPQATALGAALAVQPDNPHFSSSALDFRKISE